MPIWLKRVRIIVLAVFLLSAAALVGLKLRGPASASNAGSRPAPVVAASGLDDLRIPPFTLVDQEGRPFTNADFSGRVTVVNFIFTNCPFICPMLTESMHKLATPRFLPWRWSAAISVVMIRAPDAPMG